MPPSSNRSIHWEEFHRSSRILCEQLATSRTWTRILAISRGGLIPAGIIARELNIRDIHVLCVQSYAGDASAGPATRRETIQFLSPIPQGDGSEWLVVDDLADTGATLRSIRERLPNARYACVYAKPVGRDVLDHFVEEIPQNCWINFPWDLESSYAPPIADRQ